MKLVEKRESKRSVSKDILVLYHGNCTDGFSAAWAAWKKLGDNAEYIAVKLDMPPDEEFVGKEIYMLDFVYDEQYLRDLIGRNKKVVAIDHHITNKRTAEMVPDHLYDIGHSGAVLAWKYFHPNEKIPKLLAYVEDNDLWKHSLLSTRELWMYVDLFDFDFNVWSKLADDFENPAKCEDYIEKGGLLLKYRSKTVERLISVHATAVSFEGFKAYAVNARAFHSEVGMVLTEKFPPIGIVWGQESDGRIHISLRSDGTVDVSEIAAKFGGGGHKKAAGFYVESFSKLPWKEIK